MCAEYTCLSVSLLPLYRCRAVDVADGDSIHSCSKSSVMVKTKVKDYMLSDNWMTFFDIKLSRKDIIYD